ncbi:MAG: hypothetical protein JSU74_05670 [Candidatus Zixiibacteriota bacterium]|nr:MAG: hypothetical protein JSU74_05670 [candidate division Zixibacteria bacterium]
MLTALSKVTSHRIWFVPRLSVWGAPEWSRLDLTMIEEVDSVQSVLFNSVGVGDSSQSVVFADLTDIRGNRLPNIIANPRVMMRPIGEEAVFIEGEETGEGFKIARSAGASGPVTVDLLIIELGE